MFGTSRKNLTMFNKLCGEDASRNIILATTKWSHVALDAGQRREEQLSDTYWREMIAHGSSMARFMNTKKSASEIVKLILKKPPMDALLIQEELVDLQKRLPETEAGMTLRYTLQELLEDQKAITRQLREDTISRQLRKDAGGQMSEELRVRCEEAEKRLRSTLTQIEELKIPLGRRILRLIFGR
jgi:hypothetical protein